MHIALVFLANMHTVCFQEDQHTNANEKITLVDFCLHGSASIFVIACIYLEESMHIHGFTVVVGSIPSLSIFS